MARRRCAPKRAAAPAGRARRPQHSCSLALAAGVSSTADLIRATSACFIAVYVLALASAVRILDGPLRMAAAVALGLVTVVAVFSSTVPARPGSGSPALAWHPASRAAVHGSGGQRPAERRARWNMYSSRLSGLAVVRRLVGFVPLTGW